MGTARSNTPTNVNISQSTDQLNQAKNVNPSNTLGQLLPQFGAKRAVPDAITFNFTAGATTTYVLFNAASLYTLGAGETAFSALSNTYYTNVNNVIGCGAYFLFSGMRIQAPDAAKLSGLNFQIGRSDINGNYLLDNQNQTIVSQLNVMALQTTAAVININFAVDMYTIIKINCTNTDVWSFTFNIAGISNRPF